MSMKKFYLRKFRSAKAENRFTNSMKSGAVTTVITKEQLNSPGIMGNFLRSLLRKQADPTHKIKIWSEEPLIEEAKEPGKAENQE